jgi:hypothetical protein
MMVSILKINQFINPTIGFFKHMQFDFEVVTNEQLDIMFFANYGEKNPAPIVTKILSLEPTVTEASQLANIVESLYSVKWNKLKELSNLEYDPIHNYKDTLIETIKNKEIGNIVDDIELKNTRIGSGTRNNTRTDNLSSALTKDTTLTLDSGIDDGIYGFNSEEVSNSNTSKTHDVTTDKGTDTTINTGTQINAGDSSERVEDTKAGTNIRDTDITNDRTRSSTHEGNIGNLTTQQLMKQEIELWQWNFIEMVLSDVKDFLTIPIYLS